VDDIGRPDHGLAGRDASPRVADLHEAAAFDHDEIGEVRVRVRRHGSVRAEGKLGDAATVVGMNGLPVHPVRARGPLMAPVSDAEPADFHGRSGPPGRESRAGTHAVHPRS